MGGLKSLKKRVAIENGGKIGISGKISGEDLRSGWIVDRPDLNELVQMMWAKNWLVTR